MAPSTPARSARGRRVALTLFQLALTVAVTLFILERVGLGMDDLATLESDAWRPRRSVFTLSCAALLAAYLFSAWIWGRMVVDLGGPALPFRAAAEVYLVANLGRYVPGKLWQIAGLAVLGLKRGVPMPVSTAAAVLGQAVALGGAALVGGSALVTGAQPLGGWTLAFVALLATALAVALVPPVSERVIGLWFRLAGTGEVHVRPSALSTLRWLLLYTLNWTLYAAAFYALVRSFALPGPALQVGPAFAAAYVLGYAAIFAPAGIGVREGFLIAFLSPVMGAAQASALAIVARVWLTAVELLPAAALWALQVGRGVAKVDPPRSTPPGEHPPGIP